MAAQTGSYDFKAQKAAHDSAAGTASRYVTEAADGIMVHPGGDEATGWSIRDAIELLRSGVSWLKMWVEDSVAKVRVGKAGGSHVLIESGRITLTNVEGDGVFSVQAKGDNSTMRVYHDGYADKSDWTVTSSDSGFTAVLDFRPSVGSTIAFGYGVEWTEYYDPGVPGSPIHEQKEYRDYNLTLTAGAADTIKDSRATVSYDGSNTLTVSKVSGTAYPHYVRYVTVTPSAEMDFAGRFMPPVFMYETKPKEADVPAMPCLVVAGTGEDRTLWLYEDD